jgi:hypothetical protein
LELSIGALDEAAASLFTVSDCTVQQDGLRAACPLLPAGQELATTVKFVMNETALWAGQEGAELRLLVESSCHQMDFIQVAVILKPSISINVSKVSLVCILFVKYYIFI